MKKKVYKYGPHTCKAYMKAAGKGWEVGFHFGKYPIFVGNFIHKTEANKWWSLMNKEIKSFTNRFGLTAKAPVTFYRKFLSGHLYKAYYGWLDKQFNKYERDYNKVVTTSKKRYAKLRKDKNWKKNDQFPLRNVA